jgi:hypothetical protein
MKGRLTIILGRLAGAEIVAYSQGPQRLRDTASLVK